MKTDAIDNFVYDFVSLMLHILVVYDYNVLCMLKMIGWEHTLIPICPNSSRFVNEYKVYKLFPNPCLRLHLK